MGVSAPPHRLQRIRERAQGSGAHSQTLAREGLRGGRSVRSMKPSTVCPLGPASAPSLPCQQHTAPPPPPHEQAPTASAADHLADGTHKPGRHMHAGR